MTAGKAKVFLSVLVPYNEGEDVRALVENTRTRVDTRGARAEVGKIGVEFSAGGTWKVERN